MLCILLYLTNNTTIIDGRVFENENQSAGARSSETLIFRSVDRVDLLWILVSVRGRCTFHSLNHRKRPHADSFTRKWSGTYSMAQEQEEKWRKTCVVNSARTSALLSTDLGPCERNTFIFSTFTASPIWDSMARLTALIPWKGYNGISKLYQKASHGTLSLRKLLAD